MTAPALTLRDLNRATLARQLLLARAAVPAARAVDALGGLQAQEPRPPFLALWSRLEGFGREDLRAALHARTVVRATTLRGTLHLHGADDYRALRPLLQPVLSAGMRALGDRAARLDLDATLGAARELLAEAPRTFDELRAALGQRFPDVDERALGFAVRMHLPLAMVPSDDPWGFPRVARFTLAADWLGAPVPPPPAGRNCSDRVNEFVPLIRRHLGAFGPATARDVTAWSGVKGLGGALEALRDELVVLRGEDGREYYDLPGAPRPGPDAPAPPRLLPEFDSLLLAHDDRSRIVAAEHRPLVVTKNLRVKATLLVDGAVAGTWSVARTKTRATLTLAPFAPLRRRDRDALATEAEALLAFSDPDLAHAVR